MKKFYMLLTASMLLSAPQIMAAEDYTTPNTGKSYTPATLAAIPGSNIARTDSGYTVTGNVVIAEKDTFVLGVGTSLYMDSGCQIEVYGYANLDGGNKRATITRLSPEATPKGVYLRSDATADITVRNVDFSYACLRNIGETAIIADGCTFRYANGKLSSSGAISVGQNRHNFVRNCTFENNTVPAIGGAANYATGINIEDCSLYNNNSANSNKPQLNLTVGGNDSVVIRRCNIIGTGLVKVGGIAVGNMLQLGGSNNVIIADNVIKENRYGITGVGPMNMLIANNTMINNNHETNAMNGGSGISLSGAGTQLDAIITGNHIENSLWGITVINCGDVNIGQKDNPASPGMNVFVNNANNGTPYDLYNNSAKTIYAQNNTWSVPEQTEAEIEKVIFHKPDNSTLGEVIFMPAYDDNGVEGVGSDATALHYADGKIYLGESSVVVTIYTVDGRIVASLTACDGEVSVDFLSTGLYIARSGGKVLKFMR